MEGLPEYDFDVVIIIGNGFDLSLGLKTSYNDFVESNYFESLLKEDNHLDILDEFAGTATAVGTAASTV